jgi:predicted  nucleic acid-binding Zn-ribbon protein
MAKKTMLDGLAALVSKGFASADKKFTALAEDMADIKRTMATKTDIADMATKADVRAIVRDEIKPIRSDLKSIRDELDDLTEKLENVSGFRKEIDHALERIAAIERHLGITKKIAA